MVLIAQMINVFKLKKRLKVTKSKYYKNVIEIRFFNTYH